MLRPMVGIRGLLTAAALTAAVFAGGVDASAAGGPADADRAATLAYLRAEIAREQADLAGLPAADAAVRAEAATLQRECPGVLAGAPQHSFVSPRFGPSSLSPRAQGEAARSERQLTYLERELYTSFLAPIGQLELSNVPAFAAAVLPLRWSNPRITTAVQEEVKFMETPEASAGVCADMRFWAASGFKEVSPGTRSFIAAEDARLRLLNVPPTFLFTRSKAPPIQAAERALNGLLDRAGALEHALRPVGQALERALGLHPLEPPAPNRNNNPGVVVGRGRTAAGERWVARVRRNGHCPIDLSVAREGENESSEGWCFSRRDVSGRAFSGSVDCGEGRLTVTSFTLPATTLVRLRLSDGRTIASAPIRVPRRLGGPVGLYYQVVRGPSPIPRLLTEYDASGRVLRVTHLPAVVECTRHPLKYLTVKTVATGTVPGGGPEYSIRAERYRFLGKVYFELKAEVHEEHGGLLGGVTEGGSSGGRHAFGTSTFRRTFDYEEANGCTPHPYEIVYGILKAPGDTLLAAGATGPAAPLATAPLPASLHQSGVLVYGAFSPPAETLSIRDAAGNTLATEPLENGEFVETCEGEAEPGGPID
jgi:hypothetical protein